MIHEVLLEKLRAERGIDGFIYPDYGRCSLAEIVPTVELMFGLTPDRPILPHDIWAQHDKPRRVVLLLVDGFAYTHFRYYCERFPFLSKLAQRGEVYPLTSVFPSTTPAALTTLHTGLTPQEHGLPEWTVFFEEVGSVIETLPFRKLLTQGRDTLLEKGGGDMLYHGRTIYQALKTIDVPSHVFTYADYAKSAYSLATQRGAEVTPYVSLDDLTSKLTVMLNHPEAWGYFFVYWGAIDSAMHAHGPYSREHEVALADLCRAMEEGVLAQLDKDTVGDTLFLMCADHGHVPVNKKEMIYLDELVALEAFYTKTKLGPPIPPTGAPQDVFLFVPPEGMQAATEILNRKLDGDAVVMKTKEAIDLGLFGMGRPSERFLRRVGTILVLPRNGHHVWYRFSGHEFNQKGSHGGLSEDEMIVPLGVARMRDLI